MANTRMTFGSILGAITNTADAVGKVMETAADGVGMAHRFVESASIDQKDRQKLHRISFRDRILREAQTEVAKGNAETLAFINESDDNKKLYEAAELMFKDVFADPK